MRDGFPTLATVLKANGYATAAVINAPALKPAFRVDRGFDFYDMTPPEGRVADGTTRDALDWIDANSDGPFLMFVHYFDPHLSYSPPDPYDKRFDPDYDGDLGASFDLDGFSRVRPTLFEQMKALGPADWNHIVSLYDGEIAFTDAAIGDLLAGLEQRHLKEKSLIVFLSDHGEEFYEHGGFEHGHTLYDELIRVPLIFSLPDVLARNIRISRQVRLIDVTPTILDLVGVTSPEGFEGISLGPLLEGSGNVPAGTGLLLPGLAYAEALMHGREKKSVTAYPWKLIHDTGTDEFRLFDLASDPDETVDLAGRNPDIEADLEQSLFQALFGIADTWYVELTGGNRTHTFDLDIGAERGPSIGRIYPYRFMDEAGNLIRVDGGIAEDPSGHLIRVDDLDLKGRLVLAFQVDPPRIPVRFDIRIDGASALKQTCLGESLLNPEGMPFTVKAGRSRVKSQRRPVAPIDPPHVVVWYSQSIFQGDTALKLDEKTKKELRALGYIQ
jgi:hypothetical protein